MSEGRELDELSVYSDGWSTCPSSQCQSENTLSCDCACPSRDDNESRCDGDASSKHEDNYDNRVKPGMHKDFRQSKLELLSPSIEKLLLEYKREIYDRLENTGDLQAAPEKEKKVYSRGSAGCHGFNNLNIENSTEPAGDSDEDNNPDDYIYQKGNDNTIVYCETKGKPRSKRYYKQIGNNNMIVNLAIMVNSHDVRVESRDGHCVLPQDSDGEIWFEIKRRKKTDQSQPPAAEPLYSTVNKPEKRVSDPSTSSTGRDGQECSGGGYSSVGMDNQSVTSSTSSTSSYVPARFPRPCQVEHSASFCSENDAYPDRSTYYDPVYDEIKVEDDTLKVKLPSTHGRSSAHVKESDYLPYIQEVMSLEKVEDFLSNPNNEFDYDVHVDEWRYANVEPRRQRDTSQYVTVDNMREDHSDTPEYATVDTCEASYIIPVSADCRCPELAPAVPPRPRSAENIAPAVPPGPRSPENTAPAVPPGPRSPENTAPAVPRRQRKPFVQSLSNEYCPDSISKDSCVEAMDRHSSEHQKHQVPPPPSPIRAGPGTGCSGAQTAGGSNVDVPVVPISRTRPHQVPTTRPKIKIYTPTINNQPTVSGTTQHSQTESPTVIYKRSKSPLPPPSASPTAATGSSNSGTQMVDEAYSGLPTLPPRKGLHEVSATSLEINVNIPFSDNLSPNSVSSPRPQLPTVVCKTSKPPLPPPPTSRLKSKQETRDNHPEHSRGPFNPKAHGNPGPSANLGAPGGHGLPATPPTPEDPSRLPVVPPRPPPSPPASSQPLPPDASLRAMPWLLDTTNNDEAVKQLSGKPHGSFLVRKSTKPTHPYTLLFVDGWNKKPRRLRILISDGKYHIEKIEGQENVQHFPSLVDLITAVMRTGLEVKGKHTEEWQTIHVVPYRQ